MRSQNQTTKLNLLLSFFKFFNARLQIRNLVSYFLFLSCLLCLGIFLVSYAKTSSFDFNISPPSPFKTFSQSNGRSISKPKKTNEGLIDPRTYSYPSKGAMHEMGDAELMWRASRTPRNEMAADIFPKVAFMFLTKGSVPFAPLWDRFFLGHRGLFSIYVHSDPLFSGSESELASKSSVFYNRRVPSKEVKWGKVSMIEAERRLLANALLDPSNQRFTLLSESCIPLFNFSTIYSYLIDSTQTFVELYDKSGPTGRGRFTDPMRPQIQLSQWRKGSQWFQIDRSLALDAVADRKYFPVFQKYCRTICYSDEHYFPTLVHIMSAWRNANRTLTWVDWRNATGWAGAHPTSYGGAHVSLEMIGRMRSGGGCEYNGRRSRVCHLFARKFESEALDRLMWFANKYMGF